MANEIVQGEIVENEGDPVPAEIKTRRGARRLEKITVAALEQFLDAYADTGLRQESADKAGLGTYTIRRLEKNDEEFAGWMQEALEYYRESLVREAHRRAVKGWDEPVFSQKLGTQIGTVKKYDSRLLELMLKRHIPDFREKFEATVTHQGGVLIAPAAAASHEEWAARYAGPQLSNYADEGPPPPPALPGAATPLPNPQNGGTLPGGGT